MSETYNIKNSSLYQSINLECSTANWEDLERFFASGELISVDGKLDLIEVAYEMSMDNTEKISPWMKSGHVNQVNDKQAMAWQKENTQLWTVVIKPWILVQDRS